MNMDIYFEIETQWKLSKVDLIPKRFQLHLPCDYRLANEMSPFIKNPPVTLNALTRLSNIRT
jgi:hypothetical protein